MSDPVAKRLKMDEASGSRSKNEVQKPFPSDDVFAYCTQDFSKIVTLDAFVDKTLFIKEFLNAKSAIIVILAPRRFGKSTNMDMLKQFVLGKKKVFVDNNLKIYTEDNIFFNENCEPKPVIYMDFKNISGSTMDAVLSKIKAVIALAYKDHQYLVKKVGENYVWSNEKLEGVMTVAKFVDYWLKPENITKAADVTFGLTRLSECLRIYHGKRVYVFIDEYDHPIMKGIINSKLEHAVLEEIIDVISDIISNFLKNNVHVERGLINACVRVAEALSGVANNIKYYEFLESPTFADYYGFTQKEVDELFKKENFQRFNIKDVKDWYNGYKFMGETETVIYSSWAILNYLQESTKRNKPHIKSYWVDSGYVTYMKQLFAKTEIRNRIEQLIGGKEVGIKAIPKFQVEHILTLKSLLGLQLSEPSVRHTHLFIQLLAGSGYVNVVKYANSEAEETIVQVPNEEIKKHLIANCYCAEFFVEHYQLNNTNITNFLEGSRLILRQRDRNSFIGFANAVSDLFNFKSLPNNDDELYSVLFTLLYNCKMYDVKSKLSVPLKRKRGRLDILLILDDVGMIIELKFKNKSSDLAYAQIVKQGYAAVFEESIKVKILLGLHMSEKRLVSLTYTINDSDKQKVTSDDSVTSND